MNQTKMSEILSQIIRDLLVKYGQEISSSQIHKEFDHNFWQSLPPKIRFLAAWELILDVYRKKNIDVSQIKMQRSIESYQRQPWLE